MLIHLLNEEHLNLVSCEVTLGGDANVIGIGPTVARASETFDLCDRLASESTGPRRVINNDTVTFKTPSSRFWRPTQSDTVADNGTWPGNCKFKIAAEAGATNSAW